MKYTRLKFEQLTLLSPRSFFFFVQILHGSVLVFLLSWFDHFTDWRDATVSLRYPRDDKLCKKIFPVKIQFFHLVLHLCRVWLTGNNAELLLERTSSLLPKISLMLLWCRRKIKKFEMPGYDVLVSLSTWKEICLDVHLSFFTAIASTLLVLQQVEMGRGGPPRKNLVWLGLNDAT